MDDSAVTDYIVYKLGQHVSQNDLIFDLCQRTGKSWDQVSTLVASVQQQHESRIARQQSPIYLVLGIGVLIAGLYLACGGLFYFVELIVAGTFSIDPLALRRDYTTLIRIGTGLAMIAGASFGLFTLAKKMLLKSTK
jgi:hypothetical protein